MSTMLSLIPQCIPKKARQSQTPLDETQDEDTISWLKTLWEYLRIYCPYDLDSLEGLHILPVKQAKNNLLYVFQLTSPASIILTKSGEGSFTTGVRNVLQTLGVMLICSLPRYVISHSQVVGTYVLQATPEAALQCIQACQGMRRAHYLTQVSIKERNEFRSFIARADSLRSMSDVLCSLPIFATIQQSELVNLNDVNVMAPNDRPKLAINKLHLSPTDSPTVTVVRTLDLVQYSMSDFLTSIVLPQLKQQNYRSQNDLSQVIHFIRERWFTLQSTDLVQIIQDIPFINSDDGHFRRPQDLADPQSAFLKRFYKGESGKFPIGEYSGDRHHMFLLDLGMKDENSVSAADLLDCARKVHSLTNIEVCDCKAHAILEYLAKKYYLLSENKLLNNLQMIKWVPVLKTRPKEYPTVLKWHDGPCFVRPDEVKTAEWSPAIGAVMPVCKYSVHELVADRFGWDKAPPLEKMILQLKEVTIHYDARYKARFLEVLGFIYDQFVDIEVKQLKSMLVLNGLEEWVWCGEGFTSPKNIVTNEKFRALQPYLYPLPPEIKQWHHLFRTLGTKDKFEIVNYMTVLTQIHQETKGETLHPDILDTVIKILTNLANEMNATNQNSSQVVCEHGTIFLPDQESVLRDAATLCFWKYEPNWLEEDTHDTNLFVHGQVSSSTSQQLGVVTQKQAHYQKYGTTFDFGQHEELINRLKRIVSGYPFNQEIFKELIQNADDAGASEIHFILDRQNHPSERVMDDNWKSIQGPALCVFNNKPFTQNDIEGIQKLGQGSKETDPIKTGQYGIGFNAMYHLTDTPMFLTAGPDVGDIGEALCVLDPHQFLINGKAGIGFNDLSDIRKKYTDFFKCFLEDHVGQKQPKRLATLKKSTMFRFPLRNDENCSKISKKVIQPDEVKELLDMLAEEAKDILIFLPNIKKIKISEISQDGKLKVIYTCSADVSDKDREKQAEFYDFTKSTMSSLKVKAFDMENIQTLTTECSLDIKDNTSSQKWLVCQQMGFTDSSTLPETVRKAVKDGSLALSPRGGVAYCIHDPNQEAKGYTHTNDKKKKVFCMLPMPLDTDLPVHINGHFALGYENRRHVWTQKDGDGYKADWNDILCKQVISPCYVTMLEITTQNIFGKLSKMAKNRQKQMLECLSDYEDMFPNVSDRKPEWNTLTNAVYALIDKQQVSLMPVVKVENKKQVDIQWLPTHGDGTKKLYFCDSHNITETLECEVAKSKKDISILKDVLSECGILLVGTQNCQDVMRKHFQEAEVPINILSPQIVVDFLKMFETPSRLCNLKAQLPAALKDTVFKNDKTVRIVLYYCGQADHFVNQLQRLPLLLTCGRKQMLSIYDRNNPIYESKTYYSLIPEFSDQFVCPTVFSFLLKMNDKYKHSNSDNVNKDANNETVSKGSGGFTDMMEFGFFKEFDIQSCANMLAKSTHRYITSQQPYVLSLSCFEDRWLRKVWAFVYDAVIKMLNKKDPTKCTVKKHLDMLKSKNTDIQICMSPLQQYCLLPVKIGKQYLVYPMSRAEEILTFHMLPDETCQLFSQLPLPQPSIVDPKRAVIVDNRLSHLQPDNVNQKIPMIKDDKICDLIRCCVTDLQQKPQILLQALYEHCKDKLKDDHQYTCMKKTEIILKFFESQLDALSRFEHAVHCLRGLPLYKTVYYDVVSIGQSAVYVLPKGIPLVDMDVWRKKEGTIFLMENEQLANCYTFIGCKSLSTLQVYTEFILQHIEYLTTKGRLTHLKYLYDNYLKENDEKVCDNPIQRQYLIEIMSDIAFVEDRAGKLHTANKYYDPDVGIFITMRPREVAPTEFLGKFNTFHKSELLDMLRIVGLITQASVDMLVEFANEIAGIGINVPISVTIDSKAKILIQYLFQKGSHKSLHRLRSIAFIPKLKIEYEVLHPSPNQAQVCTSLEGSYPDTYSNLVWTEANIIPSWAYPGNTYQMKVGTAHSIVYLNMKAKPPVNLVISHLTNLCNQLQEKPHEGVDESSCRLRQKVFKMIYIYLDNEQGSVRIELFEHLKKLPCILVEGGRKLICASQTVLNLNEEITFYLYRLPAHFGDSQSFLQRIGTTETVTATQFATILNSMKNAYCKCRHVSVSTTQSTSGASSSKHRLVSRVSPLDPCQLFQAAKILRGLFTLLSESATHVEDIEELEKLALLSETGTLLLSTDLVYNDMPSFYERTGDLGLEFLANFVEFGIKGDPFEIIKTIPHHLQPKTLSTIVTEVLDAECCTTAHQNDLTTQLTGNIASDEFSKAIVRLVIHENYTRHMKFDLDNVKKLAVELTTINVKMVKCLSTHLTYKKREIKGSKRSQNCFMKVDHLGSRACIRTIYLEKTNQLGIDVLVKVAQEISKVVESKLQNSVLYLLRILQIPVGEIHAELDRHNIRQDFSSVPLHDSLVPIPGAVVSEVHQQIMIQVRQAEQLRVDYGVLAYKAHQRELPKYVVVKQAPDGGKCTVYIGKKDHLKVPCQKLYTFQNI